MDVAWKIFCNLNIIVASMSSNAINLGVWFCCPLLLAQDLIKPLQKFGWLKSSYCLTLKIICKHLKKQETMAFILQGQMSPVFVHLARKTHITGSDKDNRKKTLNILSSIRVEGSCRAHHLLVLHSCLLSWGL